MDLSLLTTSTVITFLLILFRVSGMMVTAPVFNARTIPQQAKVGLAFTISLILFPYHSQHFVIPTDLIQFSVIGAQEIILGLMLGFMADLIFVSLQVAGEYVSMQMGYSISTVLDPISGHSVPVIGQIYYYMGLLLFLGLNIHHYLVLGINHSFDLLPLGQFIAHPGVMSERFVQLSAEMFSMAILVGAPVMGVLLVTEVATAFIAKVMPQMNVFMVMMPLKSAIGMIVLAISIPYVTELLNNHFAELGKHMMVLFRG